MNDITRFPLFWPNNVPRRASQVRKKAQFGEKTIASATNVLIQEINRLNHHRWDHRDEDVILSTNLRLRQDGLPLGQQMQPSDTGAAVYFYLYFDRGQKRFKRHVVLTCDKWNRVEWNIYAIAKDIEAQRSRERWGCTSVEQAFQGYIAIPEKCGGSAWWIVLGVPSTAGKAEIDRVYRTLSKAAHPDVGGDREKWEELKNAYDQAMSVAQ